MTEGVLKMTAATLSGLPKKAEFFDFLRYRKNGMKIHPDPPLTKEGDIWNENPPRPSFEAVSQSVIPAKWSKAEREPVSRIFLVLHGFLDSATLHYVPGLARKRWTRPE